ncbi:DUF2087 domain-containing protein [Blastochloris sulfoviridis]|uniref:DUF2087 domain-containing protein n=1 Tax=Blastochloris sulfoviridis TaxID=50712 RepID=A0A5M6HN60_9HYPH|nr:DUF2087 domain-containing protein [Blastochloris sulfoviridis]KAA5597281.1 DUF2087 domain-containing protein [Blastochloris sulfoviridis]
MSRPIFPFHAEDISALARALKSQLDSREAPPGHVELLNMLARGAGWKNFQHFRAQFEAHERLEQPIVQPAPPPPAIDFRRIERLARLFDDAGRLVRWPKKFNQQQTCLWVLWSRIPARRDFAEREINLLLLDQHAFGDYALLRRDMIDSGLMTRTPDGRVYRRIERAPPPDAVALIRVLAGRGSQAA